MVSPSPLRRGDAIRIIAPAGPIDPELFEAGLAILRSRFGLVPRFRADLWARHGYLAGSDARRLEEWTEAVGDGEARAIWCARGGYGSMRLLPGVDAGALVRAPKWVIGFSDVTALHVALNQAGLLTIHGPHVTGLSRLGPESLGQLEALLFGGTREGRVKATGVVRAGVARGPLFGGSLTLLAHLCGTRWQPRLGGAVLFLEDVGEKPYRLDRYFTQLRLSGAFDGVAGVAIGQLCDCVDGEVRGAEVVRELVGTLGVPAIEGIAAGHEETNLALPLGATATLRAPLAGDGDLPELIFEASAT